MRLRNKFELRMCDRMALELESLAERLETNEASILRRALALFAEVKSDGHNEVFLKNSRTGATIKLTNI